MAYLIQVLTHTLRLGPFQDILLLQISERSSKKISLSMTRNDGLLPRKGEETLRETKNGLLFLILLLLFVIFLLLFLIFLLLFLLFLLLLRLIFFFPGLDPGGEISQDGKRTKCA